jgi:hypothetical protein
LFAQAQATRTWVSGVGADDNPCSRTAPCKTLAGAQLKTAAGGEISVLDPGGVGTITITKSLTINGNGQLTGVLASSGLTGIVVNAGVNDVVTIKDVDINGAGTGVFGIRFIAGKTLNVQNVWISGFTSNGIEFAPANGGNLVVDEVTIQKCATGIRIAATSNFSFTNINRTRITGMSVDGIRVESGGRATIRDSVISQNTSNGVNVTSAIGNAGANLENTVLNNNSVGLNSANGGGSTQISGVLITSCVTGIANTGGAVISFGNNRINGNASNGAPTSNIGQQ